MAYGESLRLLLVTPRTVGAAGSTCGLLICSHLTPFPGPVLAAPKRATVVTDILSGPHLQLGLCWTLHSHPLTLIPPGGSDVPRARGVGGGVRGVGHVVLAHLHPGAAPHTSTRLFRRPGGSGRAPQSVCLQEPSRLSPFTGTSLGHFSPALRLSHQPSLNCRQKLTGICLRPGGGLGKTP